MGKHTLVLAAAMALAAPYAATDTMEPVTFHAFAVDMSNVGSGSATLDITIERMTTPEEMQRLSDALIEKKSEGLLDELQKIKPRVGYIRTTGAGLPWDIQYAMREPLPNGGYRMIFATDRPMSFRELTQRPRSADYEYLLGELRIDKDGKGEGKLVPRAKVSYNKGSKVIEVENYASEPVRLTQVVEVKRKSASIER